MSPTDLSAAITTIINDAIDAGDLAVAPPESITIERPRSRAHGDYASNIAMQLARSAGMPARAVAELLAVRIGALPGVAKVDVAGPGFINLTLETAAQGELARTILASGEGYGRTSAMAGTRINLEYVSANPTGPIHIGGVRWAVVGDALGRLLQAVGAEVTREYYFNDAGAQIDRFAQSLFTAARGEPAPEDGYTGAYITEIADAVLARRPDATSSVEIFRTEGIALMLTEIKRSLAEFGTEFDVFFNEKDLHERGDLEAAVARFRAQGHVYEADGATWLRTTDFGDDKDRVLVKGSGTWTYFTADCAYYLDKRDRGFDKVVIMLGADHQGYVGRMKAMVSCFGDDPDTHLEILIGQLVNLVKDGAPVRMSKRAGTVLTLEDLVEAVGIDAARYALARASADSAIDLDVDLLTRQTNDNPVYYVQYAHARMCAVARNAAAKGIDRGEVQDFRPELLTHERESDLLVLLAEFPSVVGVAAGQREVHHVARYLERLAGTYHRFYDACRILPRGEEPATDLTRARLFLAEATRIVLHNGLRLLGVSAPERM
jgi:arginyl-tRNA synthetase